MSNNIDFCATCENEGYLLEVDVKYPKEVHDLHNYLPFMSGEMKINGIERLVPNLNDSQALKLRLILENHGEHYKTA